MWTLLSSMPVLEELSLSGDSIHGLNSGNEASGVTLGVKRVKLDLRLDHNGLKKLLQRCTNVETIFLDVSRLIIDDTSGFTLGWIVLWPKTLKQLYLYGLVPQKDNRFFNSFFEKFKRRNSLVAVTQNFEFQQDDPSFSEHIMSQISNEFERMIKLYACFKDFYFWIRSPSDWETLTKILRSVPDVNRLYLHLADAPDVGSLPAVTGDDHPDPTCYN